MNFFVMSVEVAFISGMVTCLCYKTLQENLKYLPCALTGPMTTLWCILDLI